MHAPNPGANLDWIFDRRTGATTLRATNVLRMVVPESCQPPDGLVQMAAVMHGSAGNVFVRVFACVFAMCFPCVQLGLRMVQKHCRNCRSTCKRNAEHGWQAATAFSVAQTIGYDTEVRLEEEKKGRTKCKWMEMQR